MWVSFPFTLHSVEKLTAMWQQILLFHSFVDFFPVLAKPWAGKLQRWLKESKKVAQKIIVNLRSLQIQRCNKSRLCWPWSCVCVCRSGGGGLLITQSCIIKVWHAGMIQRDTGCSNREAEPGSTSVAGQRCRCADQLHQKGVLLKRMGDAAFSQRQIWCKRSLRKLPPVELVTNTNKTQCLF